MQTGQPSDSRQREKKYTAISATVNLIFNTCYVSKILEMNFKNELSLQDFMDIKCAVLQQRRTLKTGTISSWTSSNNLSEFTGTIK